MKVLVASVMIVAFSSIPALAQNTPQKFVPFVVEEQDAKNLRGFLDEQQMKVGLPILQWMDLLEQRAVAVANAKAAEETKTKAKEVEPKTEVPTPKEKPAKK